MSPRIASRPQHPPPRHYRGHPVFGHRWRLQILHPQGCCTRYFLEGQRPCNPCQCYRERMPENASDRGGRNTFFRMGVQSISGDFDTLPDHGGARGGRNQKRRLCVEFECALRARAKTFHSFWETTAEVWNSQTSPFSPCRLFAWSERQVVMLSLAAPWRQWRRRWMRQRILPMIGQTNKNSDVERWPWRRYLRYGLGGVFSLPERSCCFQGEMGEGRGQSRVRREKRKEGERG